jgi:YidC/Oxa1 family membrane protein insertase
MNNFRALWWMALAFTLFMLWTEWTHFLTQKANAANPVATQQSSVTADGVPVSVPPAGDVPQAKLSASAQASSEGVPTTETRIPSAARIMVKTDVINAEFDTKGGDLRFMSLNDYAVSLDDASPFTLLSDKPPYLFMVQSGFAGQAGVVPTHHDVYTSPSTSYTLAEGANELRVPFVWEKAGVRVEKTYVFTRGSHVIGLESKITNSGAEALQASPYQQLVRNSYDPSSSFWLPTYTGGALFDPVNKFEKIKFPDMDKQPVSRDAVGGWLAMMQHYFIAAIIPNKTESMHYYSKALDTDRHALGLVAPTLTVAAGTSVTTSVQLYAGPKLQGIMQDLAPGLELTVDYGVLAFLAQPMFWLLEQLNALVEPVSGLWSWGWAIILVTMLLKAAFYKLSEAGYKSMANLRKLTPRLQHLKDNYSHDKMLFQQKMMELYKTEKINPLGGCLPILVQIPVFLALYWVLLEAVELRMTPFLWLNDLSHYDPYFILPVLMGISMVVQQKLNPPPTDPMQEKVMKFLPYIFTVFFLFIPSGLVLYWVVNNGLSIWQQWHITRQIEAQDKPPAHHHT